MGAQGEGTKALLLLARAFFHAGARALLVPHWPANPTATVALIAKTLGTMAADASVGCSEALRRSMMALIEQGKPNEAHPAYWAPFVVVGEGGTGISTPASPMPWAAPTSLSTQAGEGNHQRTADSTFYNEDFATDCCQIATNP